MERRTQIWLAVFFVGVGVIAGWFLLGGQLETSREGFGVYLVENDELVISDKDIVWYNQTSHEIKLTGEGVKKIKALSFEVPLDGEPFVVKLGGREMYRGSFWSPISSLAPSGIAIDTFVEDDITNIERWDSPLGVDPRDNRQILDYFQKAGKLIQ